MRAKGETALRFVKLSIEKAVKSYLTIKVEPRKPKSIASLNSVVLREFEDFFIP